MEDIEQAADRLIHVTAADTMQLLISDIENNNNFSEVTSILNETLTKGRNYSDTETAGRVCLTKMHIVALLSPQGRVLAAHDMSSQKSKYGFYENCISCGKR